MELITFDCLVAEALIKHDGSVPIGPIVLFCRTWRISIKAYLASRRTNSIRAQCSDC